MVPDFPPTTSVRRSEQALHKSVTSVALQRGCREHSDATHTTRQRHRAASRRSRARPPRYQPCAPRHGHRRRPRPQLTSAFADGGMTCTPRRARAVARYVNLLCDSVHHHHTTEDQILWPVIEASAGGSVDLTELTEDHAALDPRLDRLRALAAGFRVNVGDKESSGTAGRRPHRTARAAA